MPPHRRFPRGRRSPAQSLGRTVSLGLEALRPAPCKSAAQPGSGTLPRLDRPSGGGATTDRQYIDRGDTRCLGRVPPEQPASLRAARGDRGRLRRPGAVQGGLSKQIAEQVTRQPLDLDLAASNDVPAWLPGVRREVRAGSAARRHRRRDGARQDSAGSRRHGPSGTGRCTTLPRRVSERRPHQLAQGGARPPHSPAAASAPWSRPRTCDGTLAAPRRGRSSPLTARCATWSSRKTSTSRCSWRTRHTSSRTPPLCSLGLLPSR